MTTDSQRPTVPSVRVENLSKTYGSLEILKGINLDVAPGEVIAIVGPSGVGKTTLLRGLSGLTELTAGTVTIGDEIVTKPNSQVGLVFQDYRGSLMPWMRTKENVGFPLAGKGVPKKEREEIVLQRLDEVGLKDKADKYPWELSGGMQQRVSIARALAFDAQILLMDEPFGSLDAQTKLVLEDMVLDLQRRMGFSVILVTHDIEEAVYMSDRVVVLNGKPASVVDTVEVNLGRVRHQIETKSDPKFVEARNRVMGEIMSEYKTQ